MPNDPNARLTRRRLLGAAAGSAATALLSGCTTGRTGEGGAGILVAPIGNDLTTTDPARLQDLVTSEVLMNAFECLTITGIDNRVQPRLAESWTISPDRKTYTFRIRKGVKFHNGRELVADDFKYSWERALWPETKSFTAATYLNGIIGIEAAKAGKTRTLDGVKVLDPHTLQVTLDRPRAYFLSMLTYPTNSAICREAVEKTGGAIELASMIGTGPFRVVAYQPGQAVKLRVFPEYWGGRAHLAGIDAPIILDTNTFYENFVVGKADILTYGTPVTRWAQDKHDGRYQKDYYMPPVASFDYLAMHGKVEPALANPLVRQAFAHAIDRDAMVRVAHRGFTKRADGVLPPELPDTGPMPAPIPHDPARARQLLAQAGYPGGKGFPQLTLLTIEHSQRYIDSCGMIRADLLQNLGINVSLQTREAGQFFNDTAAEKVAFYYLGWIADYPDPQDFVSTLFVTGANLNKYGYSNPKLDAFCAEGDANPDPTARAAAYGAANAILMQDVPVLPTAFTPRIVMAHENVTGWHCNLSFMMPFQDVRKS